MNLVRRGGRWHFRKRVPKRFAALDPRIAVYVSLETDSESAARRKAAEVEAALFAHWEALEAGAADDAAAHWRAARALAARRGLPYLPAEELSADLAELARRLHRLDARGEIGDAAAVAADLGGAPRPPLLLSAAFGEFLEFAEERLAGKSPAQRKRWRQPRERALANLIAAIGDKPLRDVSREDALEFRASWRRRIDAGEVSANAANKDISHLSDLWGTLEKYRQEGLRPVFARLRFREEAATRPTLSREWIAERLLAPGALDGLNEEARDALLMMIETGLRPSEIVNAAPAAFHLSGPIPFFRVETRPGRALKTANAARDLPLVGVSLEAARRRAAAGFPRYRDREAQWSAAVNKTLRAAGLLPSPAHSAYSLRHAFQDRLTEAEAPERIAADLMGHAIDRPRYGSGPSLEKRAEWIERIRVS